MTAHTLHAMPFMGERVRLGSSKSYDDLIADLLADIGSEPVLANEIAAKTGSWEEFEAEMKKYVGPSEFMIFGLYDHGAWLDKAGVPKKALRVILGNPLIAITMLRHDLTAGLFVPVELIVIEEDDNESSITYVKPSSLMVIAPNPPLLDAVQKLDAKLEALVRKVTG